MPMPKQGNFKGMVLAKNIMIVKFLNAEMAVRG